MAHLDTLPAGARMARIGAALVCVCGLLAGCVAGGAGLSPAAPVPSSRPAPSTQAASAEAPLIITRDKGGNVAGYIAKREQLAASGRRVEIRGYCASACTMLTTLPNACLGPDAVIGFHAPRFTGTEVQAPLIGDVLMARYYRNGILQQWNARWSRQSEMTRISAREYVALDPETRICAG